MPKIKLAAPWTTLYREFQVFFKNDPDVKVVFDENGPELKLYVEDPEKAEALTQLLETSRTFGNVTMKITVVPANGAQGLFVSNDCSGVISLLKIALKGNNAVSQIVDIPNRMIGNPLCYVAFKREVVQFFNDNLGDLHGLTSTLYENVANDIFTTHNGVCFCTDTIAGFGMPLGEWP